MKRKVFGLVLLGLGAFLLVVGVMATVWAPGVVKKTPLDINQTTYLSGTVKKLDPATGELVENPVKVQSISKTDADASDNDYVVFAQTQCVVIDIDNAPNCVDGDDPRLVSAGTDVFATDRVTALANPDYKGLPPGTPRVEGLQNKWPFDAEKKSYPVWDGTAGEATDAVYDRTEDLLGVKCYVYIQTIKDAPITIAEGITGTYDTVITYYIDPKTGAIQQQKVDMQQYLDDGTQVVDLNIGFTEQQQKDFASDTKKNIQMLDMMTVTMPIVGFVGGVLCLLAGGALLLTARRRKNEGSSNDKELTGASA
ncbi:DUF3068 domain-containing protein [Nocardioides sp. CN2-186]|uniref:DUF3068 domain-containing protein n=1 Tax=Nocardioides tweenelious TaxID=3156607 RepID=UPI0032B48EC0